MREILFRGKRIDNGEWAEGYLYASNISGCFILQTQTRHRRLKTGGMELFDRLITIEVDGTTVGQYTGLTDKNGKKIFEGDIVRTKFGRICSVRFFCSPYLCGFDLVSMNSKHRPPTEYDAYRSDNLEIIGNIYDNPVPMEVNE